MATLSTIVTSALRESGIIPVGESPEAAETTEGVEKLATLISGIIGWELGEFLTDINYGTNGLSSSRQDNEDATAFIDANYIPANTRLVLNNSSAKTIYLPPNPRDGARVAVFDASGNLATYNVTLNGNSRKIESANTLTLSTNSLSREWFYRADTGNWARVTTLTSSDSSPFPAEYDDMLAIMLAYRLNPRYGAETSAETQMTLASLKKKFKAQYRQQKEVSVEDALLKMGPKWYQSSYSSFSRG